MLVVIYFSGCATQSQSKKPFIARDKLQHLALSTLISASVAANQERRGKPRCEAAAIGFSVSMSLGASKEMYDKKVKKTEWSWPDMGWNFIGSSLGSLFGSGCH